MEKIVLCLPRRVKMELRRWRRWTRDKGLATRLQIVLQAAKGGAFDEVKPVRKCVDVDGCRGENQTR